MTTDIHTVVWMVIGSISLVELIYFLFCTINYVYNNPQYHAFWAAFYREPPPNIKIMQKGIVFGRLKPESNASSNDTESTETCTLTTTPLKQSKNTTANRGQSKNIALEFASFSTKKKAFLNYGLDTIIYCILIPLFLIGILLYLCIRMKIQVIIHNNAWSKPQNTIYCGYYYKLIGVSMRMTHYVLPIIFCILPLKHALLNPMNANKCTFDRMLPLISIIWFLIAFIIALFKGLTTEWSVLDLGNVQICRGSHGIGLNIYFMYYVMFQSYFSLLLTIFNLIIPLFMQKRMLNNLPNNKNYNDVKVLINKINSISKRMCIAASIVIGSLVTINLLYWVLPLGSPVKLYLSLAQVVVYTNAYIGMVCVWKDWKRILCPMCCKSEP